VGKRFQLLRNKSWLIACLLLSATYGQSSHAFNYEQRMESYNGKLVSQLNNCGVHLTSGKRLRGSEAADTLVSNNVVARFTKHKSGIVAVTDSGTVYYSPNGRNLDGGGSTIKIGQVSSGVASVSSYKNDIIVHAGGRIFLITDALSSSRQTYSYYGGDTLFVGTYKDLIYLQRSDNTVKYTSNKWRLERIDWMTTMRWHGSKRIREIIPYRHGVATLTDAGLYWSTDPYQLITGEDTVRLLADTSKVVSIESHGGYSADQVYTVTVDRYRGDSHVGRDTETHDIEHEGSRGLYVALNNGDTFFSPDGKNLLGGGNTNRVTQGVDASLITQQVELYHEMFNSPNPPPKVSKIKSTVLARGAAETMAEDWFFNTSSKMSAAGWAMDFTGAPATVRLYDRGWSNWQYRWRDKGTQTGEFQLDTSGTFMGDNGVRIRAEGGCAIVTTVEFESTYTETWLSVTWGIGDTNLPLQSVDLSLENLNWDKLFGIDGCPTFYDADPIRNGFTNMSLMEFLGWGFYEALAYVEDTDYPGMVGGSVRDDQLFCNISF
jgi:hypothetical protein